MMVVSPPFDLLQVVEIVRPTESGMTQPFLCRLEDDQLHAVKGRGALSRGLLAEVYSAQIGRSLGLPIPDYAIAMMPRDLLESSSEPLLRAAIGIGPAFASNWQEPVDNASLLALRRHSRILLATLYVFDHWIANGDRTLTEDGGNSNLLIRHPTDDLIIIDHNLAFSPTYSSTELNVHACRAAWNDLRGKHGFRNRMMPAMAAAAASIAAIEDLLPDQWLEDESKFGDDVRCRLARYDDASFWEELDG